MSSWLLPIFCFALAVGCLLCALRLIGRMQWLKGWLRGMAVLAFAGAAVVLGAACYDLLSYRSLARAPWVGNISFKQTGEQRFEARLVDPAGVEHTFGLSGDQWQLDARVIGWRFGRQSPFLYRLEQIKGRYLLLEQEQRRPQTRHAMAYSGPLDAWSVIGKYGSALPLLAAGTRTVRYLPMADGAVFSLSLGPDGFSGRPLNQAASSAMADWYSGT